jgi:uncharacterized protein (TIGR03382 family)
MTPEKKQRIATASGFVSGVIACLDALREAKIVWPPDEAWAGLRGPQRLELGAGIVLMVAALVTSVVRRRRKPVRATVSNSRVDNS